MSREITEKGTKKWTKKEKLSILSEAHKNGVTQPLEQYEIYPRAFNYWKKKLIV